MSKAVRTVGRCRAAALGSAVFLCLGASAYAAVIQFSASIDDAQETGPCPASTARGSALVTLDDVSATLSWSITFGNNSPMFNNGLLDFGAESAAHFHEGAPGVAGPVRVGLPLGSPKVGSSSSPNVAADLADIKNDLYYINIHSQPPCDGGEIRGQVIRTPTCGDGFLDGGEQCDDGNVANGDCCDSTCQLEPDGQACDDGDAGTENDMCTSGSCAGTPIPGVPGLSPAGAVLLGLLLATLMALGLRRRFGG